ncbi:MAG: aminomethyltransferase family protein [Gemmatimonadota bacterium]|nr:MAG: aminomethyltransferase family protein [Gemmatimonadota bacterium]
MTCGGPSRRTAMLRGTPFHERTAPLCQAQNWRRWAGYLAASSYELTHDREYYAIRSAAALIDVSPLYKYVIRGSDAVRFLNRVLTRDVAGCDMHQVMYGPWCNEAGKVIDDGTLQRLGEESFRLTSAEPNLRWLCDNAFGLRVTIEDDSDTTAALALQGPTSREILNNVSDADLDSLKYFRLAFARAGNIPVTITRTGYTGDLGYEIWADAQQAIRLWDILMDGGRSYGITPSGIYALDVARVEAGLLLIGVDYIPANRALIEARKSSPFELGLGWAVRLEKGFVGQEALLEEWQRGPAWQFKGLELDWNSLEKVYAEFGLPPELPMIAWRTSVPVYAGAAQVGYATSGCWSPTLKKYIALAHLRSAHAERGTSVEMEVTVEHRRKKAAARVVDLPFFDPERKRS